LEPGAIFLQAAAQVMPLIRRALDADLTIYGFELLGLHVQRGSRASNSFANAFTALLRVAEHAPPP